MNEVKSLVDIRRLLKQCEAHTGKLISIGTAESATGGRIADRITSEPGSSDFFKGSVVAYSNEIKSSILGVKKETIEIYGAVSHQTAREMAEGGRRLLNVDICLSDTGIAGPAGATPGKPVGLFYFGLSASGYLDSWEQRFSGTREQNKRTAANTALRLLQEYLVAFCERMKSNELPETHVVTCFLENEGKFLLLRRSYQVGTYRGRWAGVSGYLEMADDQQALKEIAEETGLSASEVKMVSKGEPMEVVDQAVGRRWVIHPFHFRVSSPEIRIDWEHEETKWLYPVEIETYDTVPGLKEALRGLLSKTNMDQ